MRALEAWCPDAGGKEVVTADAARALFEGRVG